MSYFSHTLFLPPPPPPPLSLTPFSSLPWASQKKQALVKSCLPSPEVLPRPTYVGADLSKVGEPCV